MTILNQAQLARRSLMTRNLRPLDLLFRFLFIALVVSGASCSGRKSVYSVRGKVLFEGQPADQALVVFHPADPAITPTELPQGVVEPDGTFQMTTYQQNDGAPLGNYVVTIAWRKRQSGGDDNEIDLLPSQYSNPTTSKLTAEITGNVDLPPFVLTK
jgi:hypothetical protein